MIAFSRISLRLIAVVGGVVIIALIGLAFIYANHQEKSVLQENEQALIKVTESVSESLAAIMLQRHAKIAKDFANRLKSVTDVLDYRILRADGSEAFHDNKTVDEVNEKLHDEEFRGRKGNPDPIYVVPANDPQLLKTIQTKKPVFTYHSTPGGERLVTIFAPIENSVKCHECHSKNEAVRGVIKLTTSLGLVQHDIEHSWRSSAILIGVGLILIGIGVYFISQRTIVAKLNAISIAMDASAKGVLTQEIKVGSNDEIGQMATSFNHMNRSLLAMYESLKVERGKLSTLIQGAKEGIVVTNPAGEIVLVNTAAEELLGKSAELIKHDGFLELFDSEAWMRESLELSHKDNSPRIRQWDKRMLSVKASTIHNEEGQLIGSAALIRDITEEKFLEEELLKRSVTDGLTKLFNRRHFDSMLDNGFKRWIRYKVPFSVLMFDVDHFKKFNDTHGHECGDHVLIAIGELFREAVSERYTSVSAFRYGGEEMVLIASGMEQEQALELAEDMRTKISELVIDGLRVTVSIGVAGVPAQVVADGETLLKLADQALYKAKESGRNQVSAA